VILDAIFSIIFGLVEAVIGGVLALLPDVPGWFSGAMTNAGMALSWVGQLDAWVPVAEVLVILGAVLAAYVAGIVVGAIRWIVSYFLGGGGTT
jgi:lipoprotein signal peptidase